MIEPEVSLKGTKLQKPHLDGAILRYANLKEANLQSANLQKSKLFYAKLEGANLKGAKLQGVTYDENTEWPEGFEPVAAGAILKED